MRLEIPPVKSQSQVLTIDLTPHGL